MRNSHDDILVDELIVGCKDKSIKCQELLYKHFFGYALSVAIRYITERNEAIEIVDDSFLKVFDKIEQFNECLCFKAWLRKIVINTAIDKLREQEKRNEIRINGFDFLHHSEHCSDRNLTMNDIFGLLKKLQPNHRIVFNLFEIEGYTHKEIAELLKIPESSSRTYLTRAKKELRKLYNKYFLLS